MRYRLSTFRTTAAALCLCLGMALAHASPPESAPKALAEPDGPLSLQQAMALALARNPNLAVFAWEHRAAEARILQAGLWPNPELAFTVEDVRLTSGPSTVTDTCSFSNTLGTETITTPGGTDVLFPMATPGAGIEQTREQGARSGFSESEFTVEVSQPVLLGRKIRKRVAVAEAEKALVDWDYEIARQSILADVSASFVRLLHAQQRAELDARRMELAQNVRDVVQARVEAGRVSHIDLSKAEVALSEAQVQVEQTKHLIRERRIALASTWASDSPRFSEAAGDCQFLAPVPDLPRLRDQSVQNPELKQWFAELDRRKAVVTLARANAWPDVNVSFGVQVVGLPDHDVSTYGFSDGTTYSLSRSRVRYDRDVDTTLVLGFSVPLPVFDRNQGTIAEAAARADMVDDQRRATEVAVRTGLGMAHERLLAARAQAERIRDEILPKAQDAFDRTEEGYRQGKFGYLDVLDVQRTLFDLRYRLLDAFASYHLAAVDVERLIGQPVASLDEGLSPDQAPVPKS
ncbi:MAG: TolC family protein [bacterium]|nr:TolC family protein [bacterium]